MPSKFAKDIAKEVATSIALNYEQIAEFIDRRVHDGFTDARIAVASDHIYDRMYPHAKGGGYGMFVNGFKEGVAWALKARTQTTDPSPVSHQDQEEVMEWKTIESAPKDGTAVLLYQPTGDGEDPTRTVAIGQWSEYFGPRWQMEAGDAWTMPTHWMPLPPPPL